MTRPVCASYDDPFGDRFPTQPIAVGRDRTAHVPDRRPHAVDVTDEFVVPTYWEPDAFGSDREPAPTAAHSARSAVLVVVAVVVAVLVVAVVGVLGYQSSLPSRLSAAPAVRPIPVPAATAAPPPPLPALPPGDPVGVLGEADGVVPDGVTVFDDDVPAVANLDPALLAALRVSATDAAEDDVEFSVNSGWRSREYQEQLLREAVAEYGSEEEAARWVATADTSLHVSGDAIDIGPYSAMSWLAEHGAEHGLCQIYVNEPWHYELRPDAVDDGCPSPYADPTHDPRMQR